MKSKKLLSIILAGVTAIGLMSGCGSTNQNSSSSNNDNKNVNNTAESDSNVADDTTAAASNGKHWLYIIPQPEIQRMLQRRSLK